MKMKIVFHIQLVVGFALCTAIKDQNIVADYRQIGLCKYASGNKTRTGCKVGTVHSGGTSKTTKKDENIFTDYCQKGLCRIMGGDGAHSGCKDGVPHNGKFQHPPCSENATLIPLSEREKQLILDFHNIQRNFVACGGLFKDYGLGPGCRHGVVTWDKELEKTAFLHTSYCTFEHDKCRNTPNYPYSGQNLGFLTYYTSPENASFYINVISYLWYLEYIYTKMDMINAYYHQTKYMVGHFLTVVNERNNRIGCTLASFYLETKQKDIVMLSCNYPTTNIARGTNYNSCKEPASKCTSGRDAKYKFLCSADEIYNVSGKMTNIPYDGDGKEVFDNCGREPELFHYEAEGGDVVKKQHNATYPSKPLATERPLHATTEGSPSLEYEEDYSEAEYDPPESSTKTFLHKTPALYIFFFFIIQYYQYCFK